MRMRVKRYLAVLIISVMCLGIFPETVLAETLNGMADKNTDIIENIDNGESTDQSVEKDSDISENPEEDVQPEESADQAGEAGEDVLEDQGEESRPEDFEQETDNGSEQVIEEEQRESFLEADESVPELLSTSLPSSIYLKQEGSTTCTLASAAMMLRARMYLSNNSAWSSITESKIRSKAWVEGAGLRFEWSYSINGNSMNVSREKVSGLTVSKLKSILDSHPEGIVLYVSSIPHAVFVTDYSGSTFYCADPLNSYSGKRISLASSYLGAKKGSQTNILNSVTSYWFIKSYSIKADAAKTYSTGVYRVNTDVLNVRSGAGTQYDKVTSVKSGTELSITKVSGNWGKYEKGWVCLDYCVYVGKLPLPKGTQTISDGEYHIITALDTTKALDVDDASKENGANVGIHSNLKDAKQVFRVTYIGDGYYKIVNVNSNKCLDVDKAGQSEGTNVKQYEDNGNDAQKWIIKESGDGKWFYIISKCNGLYLDVDDGNSANGTNVQMWSGNETNAQKWRFVAWGESTGQTVPDGDYHITTALDSTKGLDVDDASTKDRANIQIYSNTADPKQAFHVEYLGSGYYKILNVNSGKSLDLTSDHTVKETNIQQYTYTNVNQQQWILKDAGDGYFYIISKSSGLYVDVESGKSENKTNVQGYVGNKTAAQKWKFVPVEEPQRNPFTDISESDYYYDSVLWAYENGVTAGITENEFMPGASCTRAQAVTFLWRASGQPEPGTAENPFTDVQSNAYYYKAVLWAYEKGIASGMTSTTFEPDAVVDRGQVVTFIWRSEGKPDAQEENPFTDISASSYYYDAVLWAYKNGITSGVTEELFKPADSCTRAQVVTFLYRAMAE